MVVRTGDYMYPKLVNGKAAGTQLAGKFGMHYSDALRVAALGRLLIAFVEHREREYWKREANGVEMVVWERICLFLFQVCCCRCTAGISVGKLTSKTMCSTRMGTV